MNAQYVTASEVADYVYCQCCWADKLEGNYQQTEEMLAGAKAHETLHWTFKITHFVKYVSLVVVVGCSILLLVFLAILYFSGGLV